MKRYLFVPAVLLLFAPARAQEPPPPPAAEPVPAPEARAIEPRADALVRQMSEALARIPAFAVDAEEAYDELPDDLPRQQLTTRRHVTVRRPDRFAGEASGDAIHRSFWYDGKTLSALDKEQNVYVSAPVPPTIDGAFDAVLERSGMVIPLADFLYADVYARLMGSVDKGSYLGLHEVAGVLCHHLSFEQETLDWQLWIDAGALPLPRKLVIVYKAEEGVPQYAVTLRHWKLKAAVPDELFRFQPPHGATRVEPAAFLAPADAASPPADPKPPKEEKP